MFTTKKSKSRNGWGRLSLLILTLLMLCLCGAQATQVSKTFKVAPLNVDGLPQSILGITLNGDGPGSSGTTKIGQYMAKSGVDVWGLSEDFNYHSNLLSGLGDGYNVGTYRGGLSTDGFSIGDIKFDTDGLEFISKYAFVNESWAAWNQTYGKFTNGADELITKGYRYYTVNFGDGVLVDFYIMHMDAETDKEDNEARASQWTQIAAAIKANNNGRPKIFMGDTNSRYTRDDIQGLFFDVLKDQYDISDVWVEKCRGDLGYPKLGEDALMVTKGNESTYQTGEIVDKVLYLNPKNSGGIKLTANSIKFDVDNYKDGDKILGDHPPVIVEFTATGETLNTADPSDWWRGETRTNATQQMYVYNVGSKYFMSIADATDNRASVSNISQATLWTLNYSNKGTTIYYNDNGTEYRVRLYRLGGTKRQNGPYKATDGATNMTFESSSTTSGAYKFKSDSRYLNIATDEQAAYTAAKTASIYNDWLLISQTQRETYDKYVEFYREVLNYYAADDNEDGLYPLDLKSQAKTVLEETQKGNYNTSAEDIKKLENIIEQYKQRYYVVKVTDAEWATTCLPKATTIPEGVMIYYATKWNKSGRYVHVEELGGSVMPANTGLLVYSESPAEYKFYIDNTGASVSNPAGNILYGTTMEIDGAYTKKNSVYMLANKTAGVGFYHVKEDVNIAARRAYLIDVNNEVPSSDAKVTISLDETSGIGGITTATTGAAAIYNASGMKIDKMQRGLNIVRQADGTVRKVVVK